MTIPVVLLTDALTCIGRAEQYSSKSPGFQLPSNADASGPKAPNILLNPDDGCFFGETQ